MNKLSSEIPIHEWLIAPISPEIFNSIKRLSRSGGARHIAVMPDVHLSGETCIGTVLATDSKLFPQAVGNDIGCGMSTISFDCEASDLLNEKNAALILNGLYRLVPANRHSVSTSRNSLPQNLLNFGLSSPNLEKNKTRNGRVQFGTLGRGNHFLEFQADEQDHLWVTVHSGSRSMGQAITDHHLKLALRDKSGLLCFEANSETGTAYINDHDWAQQYAELSRIEMLDRTKDLIKHFFNISPVESSQFSCNHNHVRIEKHFGEMLYVHRKGALSACEGEMGIIPGSMGSNTFHTIGRGCSEALCSSSHGAGRTMSRSEARRKISANNFKRQMEGIWFDQRLSKKLVDEAPSAYKNINFVMRVQRELTRVTRKLKPLLNYKGA